MARRFIRDINEDPAVAGSGQQNDVTAEPGNPGEAVPTDPIPGFLGGTHGSILFRSAIGWVWLVPGTKGQILTTQGVNADPTWETDVARSTFTWWSEPQEVVTITTTGATKSLPDVVIADFPSGTTLERAIAVFKFRQVEETSGVLNDLNGAVDIQVKKSGGSFVAAINLKDQQFQVPANARGPGDVVIGDVDLATATVDGNATFNFQFASVTATGNNLILRDVQCGIQLLWS